jgi:hypothetical protein
LLTALNPFWIINTAELNDGAVTSFLLAWSLALGVKAGQEGGSLTTLSLVSFLYGLVLALLALVRAALLPFGIVALLWYLLRSRLLRHGWLFALLAFLGFANGLAPWIMRNYKEFQTIIPIVDTAWWHLWVGNNPAATGGPSTPAMLDQPPTGVGSEEKTRLAGLKEPARYKELIGAIGNEVSRAPVQTLERRLMAGLYFFVSMGIVTDRPTQIMERLSSSLPPWVETALYGTLFGMLLLAVLGWRWSFAWCQESMPLQLAVFWVPVGYILSHAERLHGPRLPLDGPLLCLAALALVCLVPGIGGRFLRGEVPMDLEEPSSPARP